jgi:redox-sensing transcriptional repressor
MEDRHTPVRSVQRLSLYLRRLERLCQEGARKVSSRNLAEPLGLTAAQVRKDLAHFGQFGTAGVGYDVEGLTEQLRRILGTDQTRSVILVGAGHLGRALLRYKGFRSRGFEFVAAFDVSTARVGKTFGRVRVWPISEMARIVRSHGVRLAVIATPAEAAQGIADALCKFGVKGVLNFAPTTLQTPPGVTVGPVDLAATLEQLSFLIGR